MAASFANFDWLLAQVLRREWPGQVWLKTILVIAGAGMHASSTESLSQPRAANHAGNGNHRAKASPVDQGGTGASEQSLEQAANNAAQWVFGGGTFAFRASRPQRPPPKVQRKCDCEGACESCQTDEQKLMVQRSPADTASAAAAPADTSVDPNHPVASLGIIVEDGQPAGPGQMTRIVFMATIRTRLFAVCDEELAAVGRTAAGCPYLTQWLAYYDRRSAAQLERSIASYAPGARTADEVIEAVVSRVRTAVRIWTTTGVVSGIPGAGSLLGGAMSLGASIGSTISSFFGGSSGGAESVMTKALDGNADTSAAASVNPSAIRAQLHGGSGLETGLRSRMERGFGRSFANVRIHTDETAARFARGLSARAFTVGHDIAFSPGEYRPGTVAGDLLIAHELAHTVQQGAAEGDYVQPIGGDGWLEEDADEAAIGAVGSELGLTDKREPEKQSGLRLQGCQEVRRRCPEGYSWRVLSTVGFGSFGCDCIWTCRPGGPPAPPTSGPSISCPPEMNCSTGVRYEDVSADYRHHGYGAAFTPLGEQGACGCFPLNINGEQISDSPLAPTSFEMTDLAAPTADMVAAGAARMRARAAGSGGGGGVRPITDPRTGTVIPPTETAPPPPYRPGISPPPEHVAPPPVITRPEVPGIRLPDEAPRVPPAGAPPSAPRAPAADDVTPPLGTRVPPSEEVTPPRGTRPPPDEDVTPPHGTRRPTAPTGPARIVNQTTDDRYWVIDSTNSRFSVFATIEDGRELLITMRTVTPDGSSRSTVLRGAEQFTNVLRHFSGRFTGIRGSWSYEDNLREFNTLTGPPQNLPPEVAATRTWTGRQAAAHGYTVATVRERGTEGTPGAYTRVLVVFTRP